MSNLCESRVHAVFTPETDPAMARVLKQWLAALYADALAGWRNGFHSLRIEKGDKSYAWDGETDSDEVKELIGLIDAPAERTCVSFGCTYTGLESSPEELRKLMRTFTPAQYKGARAVIWECCLGEDMGDIEAYGEGMPGGDAPFVPVQELPETGLWFSNASMFYLEDIPFTDELAEVCRRVSISAGTPEPEKGLPCGNGRYTSPDLVLSGKYRHFTLNHIGLEGAAGVRTFAARMGELLALLKEEPYTAELLDIRSAVPRMLRIRVEAGGSASCELCAPGPAAD